MKNEPVFRSALKEAWLFVWHNSSLWLLGLLSALFAGSFGLGNFIGQLMITMVTGGQAAAFLNFQMPALGMSKVAAVIWFIWLVGIMIVLAIAVIYISVTSRTALLIATADYYKKGVYPKLSKIWNDGLKFFWKIFTIEVARKVILGLAVLIFGLVWIYLPFDKGTLNLIVNIVALAVAIFIGWAVSALSVFTSGYAVIDKKSLLESLKKGWALFHNHLLVSLEIGLVLTLIDALLIIIFLALISFTFLPSLFIWILAGAFGSQWIAILGTAIGFVITILLIAIFGAIYNTFYTSVWMYLFMKMHHEGIFSRLIHHIGGLFKK
jgi:hypothetical protein